jgi:hypothetical protein
LVASEKITLKIKEITVVDCASHTFNESNDEVQVMDGGKSWANNFFGAE